MQLNILVLDHTTAMLRMTSETSSDVQKGIYRNLRFFNDLEFIESIEPKYPHCIDYLNLINL